LWPICAEISKPTSCQPALAIIMAEYVAKMDFQILQIFNKYSKEKFDKTAGLELICACISNPTSLHQYEQNWVASG
jgi:hypothetical protein